MGVQFTKSKIKLNFKKEKPTDSTQPGGDETGGGTEMD